MKKKIIVLIIVLIIICIPFIINVYVKESVKNNILSEEMYVKVNDVDCILVLGAGVRNDSPSPMLKDRLDKAISLYENKQGIKIVVSGDHEKSKYDEVNIMKDYLIENGIPSKDIFMDHAGISTYDSIYRVKEIFMAKKVLIVTQEYHLYRALYIAKKLDLNALGIPTIKEDYAGDSYRELREILARNKDFFKCLIKPVPKYLGEEISLTASGDITND